MRPHSSLGHARPWGRSPWPTQPRRQNLCDPGHLSGHTRGWLPALPPGRASSLSPGVLPASPGTLPGSLGTRDRAHPGTGGGLSSVLLGCLGAPLLITPPQGAAVEQGGAGGNVAHPPPLHNCPALAAPALFFRDGATALVTPDGFCRRSRCWQGPAALRGSGRAGTGHPQATSPRPRWPSWCWEPSRPLGRGDIPLPLPPVSHPAPGWDQGWWGAPGPTSLLPQP